MVAFPGCVSELMTQLAETRKAADRVVTACVMYLSRGCLSRRLSKKKMPSRTIFLEKLLRYVLVPFLKTHNWL